MASILGDIFAKQGAVLIDQVVTAKNEGQKLPKSLDLIATLAVRGQKQAVILAENKVKEETVKNMSWIIVAVLSVIVLGLMFKK